jgi:hypothetical protein
MLKAGRGSAEPVLRHMRNENRMQLHGPQLSAFLRWIGVVSNVTRGFMPFSGQPVISA